MRCQREVAHEEHLKQPVKVVASKRGSLGLVDHFLCLGGCINGLSVLLSTLLTKVDPMHIALA